MADPQTHDRDDLTQANAEHRYEVTIDDLPVACPMPQMYLWNSHPRVYLPLHETGEAKCIYCGAEYAVTDFDPNDPRVLEQHRRE